MRETREESLSTSTTELFDGLSDAIRESILSASVQRVFDSGEKIFLEGEPKQKLFLLVKGLVKVSQLNSKGDEVILRLNVPGQVIGSLSDMVGSTLTSSAVAFQSSKVAMWSWPTFQAIMDRVPLVLRNVEQMMVHQITQLSSRICEISTAPVEFCLARTLIRMTDQIGRRVNGQLEVSLTQQVLCEMIGTGVFHVNRLLSAWERQGLVTRRRCVIVVRDLAGLKRLCEGTRRGAYRKVESAVVSSHLASRELSHGAKRALRAAGKAERLDSQPDYHIATLGTNFHKSSSP